MRVLPFETRDAASFTALASALLDEAVASQQAHLAVSAITGPAVLLGAVQRAERVLDFDACARERIAIARRATAGTAMYVGETALGFTLALPAVNALAPDATLRTLVNRNVRGFLKGLTALGALSHYFGREWIASHHRPIAIIGTTHDARGAAMLEVVAAVDSPISVPHSIAAPLEREVDRYQGKQPITLREASTKLASLDADADRFVAAFAARFGASIEPAVLSRTTDPGLERRTVEMLPPASFVANEPVRCAIGYVEAAWSPARDALWLGGDAWAPPHVLAAVADAIRTNTIDTLVLEEGAMEGARIEDFVQAARATDRVRA